MAEHPSVIELSALDGTNGFQINGAPYPNQEICGAGDVNGDGFADLIGVGVRYTRDGFYGRSYVVFGHASGPASTLELSALDGNNGFWISGGYGNGVGISVADAGDVNGDGFDDLMVGSVSTYWSRSPSDTYVVFGQASGFASTFQLSTLDGSNGFLINGGFEVAGAGDVNGDGFADMIIGDVGADPNGTGSGASYVVFGKAGGFGTNLDLSALDGSNGFQINGEEAGDHSGWSVASAGDVNGDSFADLIVGAWGVDPNGSDSGASYVVFGKASGFSSTLELSALDGANGFQINGEAAGDWLGKVASAGDVNGDGYADLIIGASGANPNGPGSGATYVVFGKASGFASNVELSALDGTDGFQINGEAADDNSGRSVAGAGDVNGDGFADLIIGASGADPHYSGSGATYVVFGKAAGFASTFELSSLDGSNGFQINGEAAGDNSGRLVAGAGDVNGDGFADLIIGTRGGSSYVVYGSKPHEAVVRTGTIIANTIHGSNFDDTLSGLGGDDTLIGHRGDDRLIGGAGKDWLRGGAHSDALQGGWGSDMLIGGGGADHLYGGNGVDTASYLASSVGVRVNLHTGEGSGGDAAGDTFSSIEDVFGSRHADTLRGDANANLFIGGRGADILTGGDGDDTLNGAVGADLLRGGGGSDTLNGGKGMDTLSGGSGADHLNGGVGHDYLNGGGGSDSLKGGGGHDLLVGGTGNDLLTGGDGVDTFIFADSFGHDTIADFSDRNLEDIDLSGVAAIVGFHDLVSHHLQTDADTGFALIDDGAGNTILLNGIAVSDIGVGQAYSGADFNF